MGDVESSILFDRELDGGGAGPQLLAGGVEI
jgi:hypothetical protein